jgi:integrase
VIRQEEGGRPTSGFRVGRADVTRPAEHVTPQMLLQRCDSPLLLAATRCAIGLAEARGWSAATIAGVFYGLKAVLDGHPGGQVPLSHVRGRARPRSHSSATRIAEVLAELGLLHDDTTAATRTWIDRRTSELPAGFGRDVRAWLVVLFDGDARTRPRSPATVHVHFGQVRPFIEDWAATRGHLREITSSDVDAVLEPLRGHQRCNAITALRSLFRFARRHGLTFADPTAHLRGGRGTGHTLLPMTAEQIRAVQQAAATPAQRLAIALAAVHAARPGAIRELTLEDIDLPRRRISIAGHSQPLGELTRDALLAWLDYRRATWPHTANRHVLITRKSALGTGPVSATYLADYLGRHQRGISLEHIRRDRILHEALATGADPLHLTLVFNIDHTNAMAYASAASNILSGPAEQAVLPVARNEHEGLVRGERAERAYRPLTWFMAAAK